jgi:hypothetical protein
MSRRLTSRSRCSGSSVRLTGCWPRERSCPMCAGQTPQTGPARPEHHPGRRPAIPIRCGRWTTSSMSARPSAL